MSAAPKITGNAICHNTSVLRCIKTTVALYFSFTRQTVKPDQVFVFHQDLLHYEQVC